MTDPAVEMIGHRHCRACKLPLLPQLRFHDHRVRSDAAGPLVDFARAKLRLAAVKEGLMHWHCAGCGRACPVGREACDGCIESGRRNG